ncbi:MAG: hypothetical protein IJS66_03095 [Bacteroidales bacterium]|nr:hypothetical protein [Bacteroidales bacterium]
MIRIFSFTVSLAALLFMAAACQSSDSLDPKNVVSQFNSAPVTRYVSVKAGTYECNDAAERQALAALSTTGLISYSVDRYAWWEKQVDRVKMKYTVQGSGYWYRDVTVYHKWVDDVVYNFCDHYVVTVWLTRKGEKMALPNGPAPTSASEALFAPLATGVRPVSFGAGAETWSDILNPFDISAQAGPVIEEDKVVERIPGEVVSRVDESRYTAYNAIRQESRTVYFPSCTVKAVKVMNLMPTVMDGMRKAKGDVILRARKVTPVGKIMDGVDNGTQWSAPVTLTYYADRGWCLD